VGKFKVNAFQRLSNVVAHKSIRQGLGWLCRRHSGRRRPWSRAGPVASPGRWPTVREASWSMTRSNARKVFCGPFEIRTTQRRCGRERVREQFLIPRLVLNELTLLAELAKDWKPPRSGTIRPTRSGLRYGAERRRPSSDRDR